MSCPALKSVPETPRSPGVVLLLLCCLVANLAAPTEGATKATLLGKLIDGDEKPVQGVDVTIRGADFEETVITDKKGRFKVTVPDAATEYEILFEREGLSGYSEALVFDRRGGPQGKEWTMNVSPPTATTETMAALQTYNAAVQAYNDGNPDMAFEKFTAAVALDPGFVDAHLQISRIHAARANHDRAAAAATRLLDVAPDHVAGLQILYDAERALGRDGAAATLDRLARLAPGPDTAILAYNEGLAARRGGNLERARERYSLATRLDPSLVEAHTALAGVLLETKQYDAALVSSERALAIDPQDVRGSSYRYNTLVAMGRNDEAQALLDGLQQLAPEAVAQAYLEQGTTLFEAGQIDGAIAALERALSADPRLAQAHYKVGLCYMNDDRNEDAKEHLAVFLELAPDDPEAGSARRLLEALRRSE